MEADWNQITEYMFSKKGYLLINASKESWSLYEGTLTESSFILRNGDLSSLKEAIKWAEEYINGRESKKPKTQVGT